MVQETHAMNDISKDEQLLQSALAYFLSALASFQLWYNVLSECIFSLIFVWILFASNHMVNYNDIIMTCAMAEAEHPKHHMRRNNQTSLEIVAVLWLVVCMLHHHLQYQAYQNDFNARRLRGRPPTRWKDQVRCDVKRPIPVKNVHVLSSKVYRKLW